MVRPDCPWGKERGIPGRQAPPIFCIGENYGGIKMEGIKMKYKIKKADGSEIDENACYFVLRFDTDEAARNAGRLYALQCGNPKLQVDINACLDWLDNPPACTCGGRDMDICCPFHDGPS